MEEQKKAAVPEVSALRTELLSQPDPLAKKLRYVGTDTEQPLCKTNKTIITDSDEQHNLQATKNNGFQADHNKQEDRDRQAENDTQMETASAIKSAYDEEPGSVPKGNGGQNTGEEVEEQYSNSPVGNGKSISGINDRLDTVSMTELYDTAYPPKIPIVDGLIHAGTYLFVGAPKVGKSFLMAQLGYHISMGLPLWEYPVRKGTVLYLALEDDHARLQRRLSRMFGMESSEQFHFATKSRSLNQGLVEQISVFVKEHANTRLVIIDTLQKVRETDGERFSYASDYEIVTRLKEFSDSKGICMLVVHHTRKLESADSFDRISGTNGLLGAADGAFVMHKEKRTDNRAVLEMAGRDQQDQRLLLDFDRESCLWKLKKAETELWKEPPDPVLEAVANVVTEECPEWSGTASELLRLLPNLELQPNILTRKLNVSTEKLYLEHRIRYETKRGHSSRMIRLTLEDRA